MKNLIYYLLISLTILSCSNDDDSQNDSITGEWKLLEARIIDFSPNPPTIDYSNQNIIYNFQSNEKLIVTGGQNVGYPNGEYDYIFGKDYLGGGSSPEESKILLVKIDNSKWTYNSTNGIMKLGQSYVDGPDLILERK